jgi:hypothetical protein
MQSAIHLKCEREGIGFRFLKKRDAGGYESGYWKLSEEAAKGLVGGWIYLHPQTKAGLSEFGGEIVGYEIASVESAYPGRVIFIFNVKPEGRYQRWRGQGHGMAWTGRPVPADLPHERSDP